MCLQMSSEAFILEEEQTIAELQKLHLPIQVFGDVDECYNYVLLFPNELIHLRLGYQRSYLVELRRGIDQIKGIYLTECSEHGSDKRVHGVFRSVDELHRQWWEDILSLEKNLTHVTDCGDRVNRLERSTMDLGEQARNVTWFQTWIAHLVKMARPKRNSYENKPAEVRRFCTSNPAMINHINDFQRNYDSDIAVRWYKKKFTFRIHFSL